MKLVEGIIAMEKEKNEAIRKTATNENMSCLLSWRLQRERFFLRAPGRKQLLAYLQEALKDILGISDIWNLCQICC